MKMPNYRVYEGTDSDGFRVKVMAKSYAEALDVVGNGANIKYVETYEGMKVTLS